MSIKNIFENAQKVLQKTTLPTSPFSFNQTHISAWSAVELPKGTGHPVQTFIPSDKHRAWHVVVLQ